MKRQKFKKKLIPFCGNTAKIGCVTERLIENRGNQKDPFGPKKLLPKTSF